MILPAARERLEALLRHRSMEGALAELRANAGVVSITGLHDVAKALVAEDVQAARLRANPQVSLPIFKQRQNRSAG